MRGPDVQPDLPFRAKKRFGNAPASDPQDLCKFVAYLSATPDWVSGATLFERYNWNERTIRALANAASPEVISGQLGYKHIQHSTEEEVHHFCSWMESQAKKMMARSLAVRRRAHQLVG